MFTGIVEEVGTILAIRQGANSLTLSIRCSKVLSDVQKGDSIAVDGVCLTVATYSDEQFTADVMPETVKATTIQSLRTGSTVNLERAMAANSRFGGHIVSGHVDATGEIIARKRESNAIYMEIMLSPDLLKYLIPKGSIAVDGTSLTVFGVTDNSFIISLIPVTQDDSIIGHKQIGDRVNIECDMLAKYMERLMTMDKRNANSGISMESLAASGFLD
ncbi:riboflavin synthase [Sporosarcina sp. HYO08]|uniref:riboflavin synthase n=1 Tax=Sporosarcina sp. HYO08 TaxID=1759557 RepID=UPI00079312F5|nr:riboflavin synthase [Sporosarcina sp. HYO08]KXH79321.1 riboflavin synthase subunit alpha [Sporosarcina sp. HYO08]